MPRRRARPRDPWWIDLPRRELDEVPLRDLDLQIEGTALEHRVAQLHRELERAGLRFRPHVWLSTDWFTPEGVPGFAIPFFLAHPRLMRIEHREMLGVEGGTHSWCMKLMRHETGHAIDNAHRLHRRKAWRETFGRYGEPYRPDYAARPGSRNHVLNLDGWYAQSHPAEDWAETFAVWLTGPRWRSRYREWPAALRKLRFVDGLMEEIADRPMAVPHRSKPDSLRRISMTLGEYYRRKKAHYEGDTHWVWDRYLCRLFGPATTARTTEAASAFLRRSAHSLRYRVSQVTGHSRYEVDQALRAMISRCRELGLRRRLPVRDSMTAAAALLTVITVQYVNGARQRFRR